MAIHDTMATDARPQQLRLRLEKPALGAVDFPHKSGRKRERRIEENSPIVAEIAAPFRKVERRRDEHRTRVPVKCCQGCDEAIKIASGETMIEKHALERPGLVEPTHDYEPIDGNSRSVNRKAARRPDQRHDFQIDVICQSAVQLQLGAAGSLPPRERREIEVGKAHRFLELEHVVVGEEDPGHMGFPAAHLSGGAAVEVGPAQKCHFVGECRLVGRSDRRLLAQGCFSARLKVIAASNGRDDPDGLFPWYSSIFSFQFRPAMISWRPRQVSAILISALPAPPDLALFYIAMFDRRPCHPVRDLFLPRVVTVSLEGIVECCPIEC